MRVGVALAATTALALLLLNGLLAVWPHSAYALTVLMALLVAVLAITASTYLQKRYFASERIEFRWAQMVWWPVTVIVTVLISPSGEGSSRYLTVALALVMLWTAFRQRPRGRRPAP